MSSTQYIYLQQVPQKKLQDILENALQVSMIPAEQPDWFFYYDHKDLSISAGLRKTLDTEHNFVACSRPVITDIMILVSAPTHNLAGANIAAVKCLNAILEEFDTDVVFMFEDDTLRLVRCNGEVFLNWSGTVHEPNFWNRPAIGILEYLTVPYTMQMLQQSSTER